MMNNISWRLWGGSDLRTKSFSINLSWTGKNLSKLGCWQELSLPFPGNASVSRPSPEPRVTGVAAFPQPADSLTLSLGADVGPDVVFSICLPFPLSPWNQTVLLPFLSFSKYLLITHCVLDYTITCEQNRCGLFYSPFGNRQTLIKHCTQIHIFKDPSGCNEENGWTATVEVGSPLRRLWEPLRNEMMED